MINIREIIRRIIKYIILILVIGFACYSIPKNKISNLEIVYIMLVSGMIYNILDLVTPSINLKVIKTNQSSEILQNIPYHDENDIKDLDNLNVNGSNVNGTNVNGANVNGVNSVNGSNVNGAN